MKKIILFAVLILSTIGIVYAETAPTEEDYKNLEEMRLKLGRMRREMDKFMKDVIATYPDDGSLSGLYGQDIRVDVTENDKDILVKADLPGMEKDKIDITLEKARYLKIAGSRDVAKKESSPGLVRQERSSGRFQRVVELPAECLNDGIKATYKNGVLEVVIPKKAKTKEEEVKINIQ
jgi:HSP20 family protein